MGCPSRFNTYTYNKNTLWAPTKTGKWGKKLDINVVADEENIGRSHLTQMPINPSNPPPMATLDSIPILDSKNNPAKISFMITITYDSEIDFEYMSGNPQRAGFHVWGTTKEQIQNSSKTNLCKWPMGMRNYTYVINNQSMVAHR